MQLINCNMELKLRWTKHCVLPVAGTNNANGNDDDNIIFTIKDTKLYVSKLYIVWSKFISKRQSNIIKTL